MRLLTEAHLPSRQHANFFSTSHVAYSQQLAVFNKIMTNNTIENQIVVTLQKL